MRPRLRTIRNVIAFAAVFAVWLVEPLKGAAPAKFVPLCEDVCSVDYYCGQVCDDGSQGSNASPADSTEGSPWTTCSGWNDGWCENTCEGTCGPGVPGETFCTANGGSSSTCGDYGPHLECGDDVCAGDEDYGSCPADCREPPSPDENDFQDAEDSIEDAELVVDWDDPILQDGSDALGVLGSYGIISGPFVQFYGDDDGLEYLSSPTPTLADGSRMMQVPTCASLNRLKGNLEQMIHDLDVAQIYYGAVAVVAEIFEVHPLAITCAGEVIRYQALQHIYEDKLASLEVWPGSVCIAASHGGGHLR